MTTALTNPAHEPGYTSLTFSPDGKWAYTGGGADTLVRVWRTDKGADQEPEISADATEGITSLSTSRGAWLSGSEDGDVRSYAAGDSNMEGMVTSAVGVPIRCVAIDPKGQRVAVTSDELSVKLVDIEDNTKIIILNGHTRGVRKATWHPSGSLLTTSGSDGKIIVWDVSEDQPKQEKIIEGVIPAVSDNESPEFIHDSSALWHPSGQYFFVATRTHEIVTISRPSFTYAPSSGATYVDSAHPSTGPITALAVSPNGLYLASASEGQMGEVWIWSVEKKRVLWRHTSSSTAMITHLAFSPTQNLLAWTDNKGVLTRWPSPIPSTAPDPVKTSSVSTTAIQGKRRTTPDLFEDGVDAKAGEDGDTQDDFGMDDDWIIDDIGGGMEDDPPERERVGKGSKDGFIKEMVSITKAQPAFQPGSTPMDKKKRYLAFNMIGAIEVTDQDTHHIVNIVFHDQSSRKGYHFTDHFKYDLASLGERGILFACQPENDHPAQVLYKPYTSWSSSSSQHEWTYPLKRGSKVVGLAAGGSKKANGDGDDMGNLVIATSENDLTFMTGNKAEKYVMGLDGEFVSMVAGEDWVFFVYRPGATTIDGSQNLMGALVSFDYYCAHQRLPLPIAKGHTLKWIGITEEGAPAVYDSSGLLHIMANFGKPSMGTWARVLDTNALERQQGDAFKQESYWPIGASQDTFSCIIVKGTASYPGFPRPFPSDFPMRMPFRGNRGDDPKKPTDTVLEEQIAREMMHLEFDRDKLGEELTTADISRREMEQDKKLIKLINTACKDDRASRAISWVKMLNHLQSFDGAIKIAEFYRLVGLKEKIELIKAERQAEGRLEKARDKRRELAALLAPRPPPRSYVTNQSAPRPGLLEDFRPPPVIHRPGLAPAIPVIETTRYSTANLPSRTPSASSSTTPESKRKRDEESDSASKRRALESESMAPPPPKAKTNPFARKPGQEISRNPFARKLDANKTIQKSESFFDKVDAAETDKGKRPFNGKLTEKEKKEPTRQSTLFGLPLGQPTEKPERGRKKKVTDDSSQSQTLEGGLKTSTPTPESVPVSSSDITMAEAEAPSEDTLVETQQLEEAFETQVESLDVEDDTNEETQEAEEPIEWPPSPPAMPSELAEAATAA